MDCRFCRRKLNEEDARGLRGILRCPSCGRANHYYREILYSENGDRYFSECREGNISRKSGKITLVLCIFLGLIGAHHIYLGRHWRAVAYLLTLAGLGAFWIVDLMCLLLIGLRDVDGMWVRV